MINDTQKKTNLSPKKISLFLRSHTVTLNLDIQLNMVYQMSQMPSWFLKFPQIIKKKCTFFLSIKKPFSFFFFFYLLKSRTVQ